DLFTDYGVPAAKSGGGGSDYFYQNSSNTKGAFSWNQALKPETDASKLFATDKDKATELRGNGFGVVLTHQKDGIARGSGALVSLGDNKENFELLKDKAAAFYSFDKG